MQLLLKRCAEEFARLRDCLEPPSTEVVGWFLLMLAMGRIFMLFRILILLMLVTSLGAAPMSKKDCFLLTMEWRKAQRAVRDLEAEIDRDMKGKRRQAARDISDALAEAKDVLDQGDVEAVKEKLDKLRERLKLQAGKLKEFLDGTSEGLGKTKAVMDKATKALDRVTKAVKILKTNRNDPASAIEGFSTYVDLINDLLSPLTSKIPGLGQFMDFYVKALSAASKAIGKIAAKRNDALMQAGGKEFHPRYQELLELERKRDLIARRIRIECGDFYGFWKGWPRPLDFIARRQKEEKAIQDAKLAATKESNRVKKVRNTCKGMVARLKGILRKMKGLGGAIKRLGKRASTARGSGLNEQLLAQAKPLRKRLRQERKKFYDLRSSIWRKCGQDAQDLVAQADKLEDATSQADSAASSGIRWIHIAQDIVKSKDKLASCQEECRECLKELAALQKQLDALKKQLQAKQAEIKPAEDRIKAAAEAMKKVEQRSKTYVYEDSRGNLVLSATKTAPGLSYKGWGIFPGQIEKVRAAEKIQKKAEEDLKRIRQEAKEIAKKLKAKAVEVAAKQRDCDACRKKCQDLRQELVGTYGPYLSRFKDPQTEVLAGKALDAEASQLGNKVKGSLQEARELLEVGQKKLVVVRVPDLSRATPFSGTYAPGKSPKTLKHAAQVLAAQDGGYLVSTHQVQRVDAARLAALARGEKPPLEGSTIPYRFGSVTFPATTGESLGAWTPPFQSSTTCVRPPSGGWRGTTDSNEGLEPEHPPVNLPWRAGVADRGSSSGTGGMFGDPEESRFYWTQMPDGSWVEVDQKRGDPDHRFDNQVHPSSSTFAVGGTRDSGAPVSDLVVEGKVQPPVRVRIQNQARWDVVKAVIRRFIAAYVSGDLSGVMRTLSGSFLQDPTVLRNALQEDFKRLTSINLDIELFSYRLTRDSIQVEVRWNRSATDQQTGVVSVLTGSSRMLFGREGGFGFTGWYGSTPFGRFDTAWRKQAEAGAVNESDQGTGGSLAVTGLPVVIDDLNAGTSNPNHFFLNLAQGVAGGFFLGSGGCSFSTCSQAGMDMILGLRQSGPSLFVVEGQGFGGPEANRKVGICSDQSSPLEHFGGVTGTPNFSTSLPQGTPATLVVALLRPDGSAALVELKITSGPGSGQYTVSSRWVTGANLAGVGSGSNSCSLVP
jgi:hypothetical protein